MIEAATVEDMSALMADLCLMFEEMAPFGDLDIDKSEAFLKDSIENHLVLLAIDDDTKDLVGHMGLRVESHWYTSDNALYEYYVYVKPKYRKTRTAFHLYTTAKAVAREVGLPFFYGTFRNPESGFDRVNKFLQRQGGVQIGAHYLWKG